MSALVTLGRARARLASRVELGTGAVRVGISADRHREARALIVAGFEALFGYTPSLAVAQIAQAQALHESSYGRGWGHGRSTAGQGSHNWGAIQGGIASGTCSPNTPPPVCAPGQGFLHGDSTPTATGPLHYQCCYRIYPDDEAGVADLLRKMFVDRPTVLEAAERGDLAGYSAAMRDTVYYEGTGPTREDQILGHMRIMADKLDQIAGALDEPVAIGNEPLDAERAAARAKTGLGLAALGAVVGLGAVALLARK